MSAFCSELKLDGRDGPDDARSALRDALASMTPASRKETVERLKDLARSEDGTEIGSLLDSQLPGVEKEASRETGVDRLLDLLFMLMLLLGQANTLRNGNAAKFGEISVKQAEAAGAKGISAANAGLAGAATGMLLGTAVAGVGFGKYSKANKGQIKNIRTNARDFRQSRQENARLGNALNRSTSPLNGSSPQERLRTLDAQRRAVQVQNNQPHLSADEHAVLSQPMLRTQVRADAQDLANQENYHRYAGKQYAGQIVGSFAPQLSSLAQSGAGTAAAGQNAAAKVNDAEGAVASTVQHSEEQAAQRSVDLLMKIFSLVEGTSQQHRGTLDYLAQGIKV
ncbi:hypothetical protein XthCFBP4691_12315 [Xanthomonas theicola]|uniref:Uncharacterized protein n=2 Tax=Xanthomonas theicola TaxID=56464 RepID=A0A2S6ZDU9_9XANT|nr:hypothetical protein XthCFBP4691_12315 [Xanthomonas theicola]